jgi:hypothetical protein
MDPARSPETDREIARRAYALWEKEGRPHGRDRDHWARAEHEVGAERETAPAPAAQKPARPRKAPAEAALAAKKPARKAAPAAEAPQPARKRSSSPA